MAPPTRQDAAILVFARSPERDALRWGWTQPAALDARRSLLASLFAKIAPMTGAKVLVFHDGDPADLLATPGVHAFVPQSGTTFAQRLQNALAHAFARRYRRVVLIGTDIPALSRRHLQHALTQLDHTPLVIGPNSTGSAYLLAATLHRDYLPRPLQRLIALVRHLLAPQPRPPSHKDRTPGPPPADALPQALRPTGPPMPLPLSHT